MQTNFVIETPLTGTRTAPLEQLSGKAGTLNPHAVFSDGLAQLCAKTSAGKGMA